MKRTIILISIIAVSIGAGLLYDFAATTYEKRSHPMPAEYLELIAEASVDYRVPQEIIYAVIKNESSFRSTAVSPAGAVGLMQIMPATFGDIMRWKGESIDDGLIYNPAVNIDYGVFYLRRQFDAFGNWDLAFAAYNAGPARVRDWLSNPAISENGALVNIPFDETKNYIKKVNRSIEMYRKFYF